MPNLHFAESKLPLPVSIFELISLRHMTFLAALPSSQMFTLTHTNCQFQQVTHLVDQATDTRLHCLCWCSVSRQEKAFSSAIQRQQDEPLYHAFRLCYRFELKNLDHHPFISYTGVFNSLRNCEVPVWLNEFTTDSFHSSTH